MDSLLQAAMLSACFVDHDGWILEVSEGWKFVSEAQDLGIGGNILRHWLSPDFESTMLYRGFKKVLSREAPFFATLLPNRGVDGRRQCTMMAALPVPGTQDRSAIFQLELPSLDNDVTTASLSRDIVEQMREALADVVRRTIRHEFSLRSSAQSESSVDNPEDLAKLRRLSDRQVKLLAHLSGGASNAEIARSLGMSLAVVKGQTTAIMRKLGFENRTQAALFAAKLRLNQIDWRSRKGEV